MPVDKKRIPHAGETVYIKNDPKCIAMYLDQIFTRNNVNHARCLWTEYEMLDDELIGTEKEKEFLLSDLTVYPPVTK